MRPSRARIVIEYRERQHSEAVAIMERRFTISGCSRGQQRRRYDARRRTVLPEHGIKLIELDYTMFYSRPTEAAAARRGSRYGPDRSSIAHAQGANSTMTGADKAIGPTKRTQVLSSGITIRQDFRDAVRFVFFDTGWEDSPYGTHGGTAFVINCRGKPYAMTCAHVRKDFEWSRLAITNLRLGDQIARLRAIYYPSNPIDAAVGSDIVDLVVAEFVEDLPLEFFQGTAYVIDANTVATAKDGHSLLVAGVLKEKSQIVDDIAPAYCLLQFQDIGASSSDTSLREAVAQYRDPEFRQITGLSGSPVYDQTSNSLCGMVIRGGVHGGLWRIWYVDIFDIMKLLEAIHAGRSETYYQKTVRRRVT